VVPYLALHPMGFSVPRRLLFERWALTPPFHPYLRPESRRRSVFCGTVRRARLSAFAPACILVRTNPGYAASRPVEFGLSSPDL